MSVSTFPMLGSGSAPGTIGGNTAPGVIPPSGGDGTGKKPPPLIVSIRIFASPRNQRRHGGRKQPPNGVPLMTPTIVGLGEAPVQLKIRPKTGAATVTI